MASEHVTEVNESNWETTVLKSELPVLVDFWASWCGPCLQLAPTIDELAAELDGKVKVVKATIEDDHNKEIASGLGIMGIPALIVYKGGEPPFEERQPQGWRFFWRSMPFLGVPRDGLPGRRPSPPPAGWPEWPPPTLAARPTGRGREAAKIRAHPCFRGRKTRIPSIHDTRSLTTCDPAHHMPASHHP